MTPRRFRYALALLLFLPIFVTTLPQLASGFLGVEYVNHYGTQWFYWYIEREMRALELPEHSDLFFFPWGKDIFGHTGSNVLDGIFAIPFRMLFGGVLGYNLFVLVGLVTNVLAFRLLARDFSDDEISVDAAALFFGASPYLLFELSEGRPTQALVVFPVLFVRHILRTVRRPGLRDPAIAGVMLALTGYMYWYYAAFGGVLALALAAVCLWRPDEGAGSRFAVFMRLAVAGSIAMLLVAPTAVPLVLKSSTGDVPGLLDVSKWNWRESPPITREQQIIAIFTWQPFRRHAGFYLLDGMGVERLLAQVALLPWMTWPLVALAIWRPFRLRVDALVAMLSVTILLAMGPLLVIGNTALPNVPYIYLVKAVGFMQRLWWPSRAVVFITILSSLAFVSVFHWLGTLSRRIQLVGILALAVAWLVELRVNRMVPFGTWDATVPAGYQCLASGDPGAVIELPYGWTQGHLYYQTAHGRPILGGMLEDNAVFTPTELVALKKDNTWLARLLELGRKHHSDLTWTEADKSAIQALGYRYLVLQLDAFYQPPSVRGLVDNALHSRLRRMRSEVDKMAGAAVYEDARLAIYAPWGDPPPCDPRKFPLDRVALGKTETSSDERTMKTPDEQIIERPWATSVVAPEPGPADSGDTDTDTDSDTDGPLIPSANDGVRAPLLINPTVADP